MALKEMLRVELNAEGSAALDAIMKATGLKRTQVVHLVLAEMAKRENLTALWAKAKREQTNALNRRCGEFAARS